MSTLTIKMAFALKNALEIYKVIVYAEILQQFYVAQINIARIFNQILVFVFNIVINFKIIVSVEQKTLQNAYMKITVHLNKKEFV